MQNQALEAQALAAASFATSALTYTTENAFLRDSGLADEHATIEAAGRALKAFAELILVEARRADAADVLQTDPYSLFLAETVQRLQSLIVQEGAFIADCTSDLN